MSTLLKDRLKKVRHEDIELEDVGEMSSVLTYEHKGKKLYYLDPVWLYEDLRGDEDRIGTAAVTLEDVHDNIRGLLNMSATSFAHNGHEIANYGNRVTRVYGTLRRVYIRYLWIDHDGVVQPEDRNVVTRYEIKVRGTKHPGDEVIRYTYHVDSAMDCFAYYTTGTVNNEIRDQFETEEEFIEAHEGYSLEDVYNDVQGQSF